MTIRMIPFHFWSLNKMNARRFKACEAWDLGNVFPKVGFFLTKCESSIKPLQFLAI